MAGFHSSSNSINGSRFARLSCEQLETRDCPAVISLNVAVIGAHQVELTGQITDGPAAGIEVVFHGAVSGSAVTSNDGTFSYITNDADLGSVYAVGVVNGFEVTNFAHNLVASDAPAIGDFSAQNTNSYYWYITGRVVDEHVAGLIIRFGGAAEGRQATVLADGTFSMSCAIYNMNHNLTWADVTDWWGLESNTAVAYMF